MMHEANHPSQLVPALFCRILSPYSTKQDVEACLNSLVTDETLLDLCVALANKRYMIATFFSVIKAHELDHLLNDALHEYMHEMTAFMQQRGEALSTLAKAIIRMSNEHEITPILLKGSGTLFSAVYPRSDIRFMSDLDILFKADEVMTIHQLLCDQGFMISEKHAMDVELPAYVANPSTTNLPLYDQHLLPLYREGDPCTIELHVRPLNRHYQSYLDADGAFETAKPIVFQASSTLSAQRLSPENEVIYCFVHSQLAHGHHQCHYFDVLQMDFFVRLVHHYEAVLDWDNIHLRIKQAGGAVVFQHYLFAVNRLFATTFPLAEVGLKEQQMIKYYRSSLRSCFPHDYPLWKLRFFVADISRLLSREKMQRLYSTSSVMGLWIARFKHLLKKLWKFRRPSALKRRFKHAFRMF